MFGNSGEGSELSDELKEEGDLVVGDRQEPSHSQPVKQPEIFYVAACAIGKKWRGSCRSAY
jgi:hypothetical protein